MKHDGTRWITAWGPGSPCRSAGMTQGEGACARGAPAPLKGTAPRRPLRSAASRQRTSPVNRGGLTGCILTTPPSAILTKVRTQRLTPSSLKERGAPSAERSQGRPPARSASED
jgi:hypothetical protein